MRKTRKLLWQIFPSYLLIIVASLATVAWYATRSVRQTYVDQVIQGLQTQAVLAATLVKDHVSLDDSQALQKIVTEIGAKTQTRITIVVPPGRFIADSEVDVSAMVDDFERPEETEALAGKVGSSFRESYTTKRPMAFVAVPVKKDDRVVAVVRAGVPTKEIDNTLRALYREMAAAGLVVALIVAVVSFFVSRRLAGTINEIKEGAERFASGDLLYRLGGGDSEELSTLAEAMNRMAEQLYERLTTITSQRNELEAVLYGMVEAVLVVDSEEHVLRLNRAAEHLFEVQALQVQGRSIQEAIRNTDLQGFVQKCLKDGGPVEGDLQFPGDPVQYIQAHGSVVRDGEGRKIGAVVVLNDITRLKQLEDIRRDFVANVSHELKTPITSIKGFLETLQEGAIDDRENAEKFLSIMEKQTDRLNAIIEDLLSLSRIEQHVEKKSIILREASVAEVVDAAANACVERAQEKDITIKTNCEDVVGRINPTLLEQALINLVDNAVKYSEPESTVTIRCSRSGSEILLEVEDQGCGIPKEHHSRIFERFYRVDKARSRQIGGTGLGLAIVKHIVLAHCGRVTLDSAPGKGTTFSIHLPLS